jgi:putative intracellular protease/amidase|tara:strand:- start:70 stop:543 length:474 start_codon:yes stop_codon:yes gene_type:complete
MDNLKDYLQNGIALLGTGLASLGSAGIIPSEYAEAAAIGGGLALVAIAEKLWRQHKDTIVNELEEFVEDKTGLDIELDEVVDSVVEAGLDVATDIAEDGVLDTPLSDVAEELAADVAEDLEEALKDMTINALREMLSERGLDTDGKKVALIERLLNA